jgi:hypothetical protein
MILPLMLRHDNRVYPPIMAQDYPAQIIILGKISRPNTLCYNEENPFDS